MKVRFDAALRTATLSGTGIDLHPYYPQDWGFGINSLVEYEWNETFAGRK